MDGGAGCGGDEIGAIALGGFQAVLQAIEHQMLMVVNPFRPFTRDVESIEFMCREIERASRLKMQGLISNPNLGQVTKLEHVISGHQIVAKTAQKLDLPIVGLGVLAERLEEWTGKSGDCTERSEVGAKRQGPLANQPGAYADRPANALAALTEQLTAIPEAGVPLLPIRIHLSPDWLLKQAKIETTKQ